MRKKTHSEDSKNCSEFVFSTGSLLAEKNSSLDDETSYTALTLYTNEHANALIDFSVES